jgi:hypothetical protein
MTEQDLSNAISETRERYLAIGAAASFADISTEALSGQFATEVMTRIGGNRSPAQTRYTKNFTVLNEDGWDWKVLREYAINGALEPFGLATEQVDALPLCFPEHVFIEFNRKFYDAECPDGTSNLLELPIYSRALAAAIKQNDISPE